MAVTDVRVRSNQPKPLALIEPLERRSAFAAFGATMSYVRNNTIFSEGEAADYCYEVLTGAVRLSKMMSDGRRQIAEFALPGDYFGINWLEEHAMTAEALSDVKVACYARGRLETRRRESRSARRALCQLAA
jgi:CRP/FNR family nitrogen fixation transcriptional regulator